MVNFALMRAPGSAVAHDRATEMAAILHELGVDHTRKVQMEAVAKCSYLLHEEHGLGDTVRNRLLETIMHCVMNGDSDVRLNAVKAVRSAADQLKPRELERVIQVFLEATREESRLFRRYTDPELVEAINVAFQENLDTSCTREEVRVVLMNLMKFGSRVPELVREEAGVVVAGAAAKTAGAACVLQ